MVLVFLPVILNGLGMNQKTKLCPIVKTFNTGFKLLSISYRTSAKLICTGPLIIPKQIILPLFILPFVNTFVSMTLVVSTYIIQEF